MVSGFQADVRSISSIQRGLVHVAAISKVSLKQTEGERFISTTMKDRDDKLNDKTPQLTPALHSRKKMPGIRQLLVTSSNRTHSVCYALVSPGTSFKKEQPAQHLHKAFLNRAVNRFSSNSTMAKSGIPFIDGDAVRKHLKWDALCEKIEEAMKKFSSRDNSSGEEVVQPVRQGLTISKHDGWLGVMPAAITGPTSNDDVLATKLVTMYPRNAQLGLPTHHAIVVLFDYSTGTIKAILDGTVVTELRTAATSAVAVKHLARRTDILAVIGTGVQGRSHIRAFLHLFNFKEVRVCGRNASGTASLVETLKKECPDVELKAMQSINEAVDGADVIVTATTATEPILGQEKVKNGALIVSVGAPQPDWQELTPQLVKNSYVIADSREGALKESGDVIKSQAEIFAELGEIIAGSKKLPGHVVGQKTIIFKSLGMAIQDAVASELVYQELQKESA